MRTEMSGLVRKSGLALMLLVTLVSGAYSQSTLRPPTRSDFDGDNWEDIGVYRDGVWWFTTFRGNQAFAYARVEFGLPTDIPVPADYDGDLKADIAVFRPSSGEWFILESATNTIRWQNFGFNGDLPV